VAGAHASAIFLPSAVSLLSFLDRAIALAVLPTLQQETVMTKTPVAPYLIAKDEEGQFRITVRTTRFNSWNYPLVTSTLQPELFKSAMAARAHAKREFGAEPGQFASK
jgi:hypothetical protein